MRDSTKARLIDTSWGPAIDFNGELVFLDIESNRKNYLIGNEYYCEIYYTIMIAVTPDTSNKNWLTLKSDSIKDLLILQKETTENILNDDFCKKRINQEILEENRKYFESKKTIGKWFKIKQ